LPFTAISPCHHHSVWRFLHHRTSAFSVALLSSRLYHLDDITWAYQDPVVGRLLLWSPFGSFGAWRKLWVMIIAQYYEPFTLFYVTHTYQLQTYGLTKEN
jgi:hypothetical protein